MLIAAPASAGTFGAVSAAEVQVTAATCVGVRPVYADVLVRAAWTETIEHPGTWLTEARFTRWVVDQAYRPAVPAETRVEHEWSSEPLEGWTPTGETRYIVTQPAVPGSPEIPEQTEQRLVDPGQEYVAPTVELVTIPAVTETVHHPATWETVHHPAVEWYEFRQRGTGETRWQTDPSWNAEDVPASQGWESTGQTRTDAAWDEQVNFKGAWDEVVVVTPARTEERIVDPGQEYVAPTYETVVLVPYQPAVPAVPEQGYTVHEYTREVVTREAEPEVPEAGHLEERWVVTSPGEGWQDTGTTRQVAVEKPWTEEVHHPAEYERRMTEPGVTCPGPATPGGGGTGGTGARPGTVVPVVAPVTTGAGQAAHTAASGRPAMTAAAPSMLPSTGTTSGLLTLAAVIGGLGAAFLAARALGRRVVDGVGRHRLDRARDTAMRERPRRDPARRHAHRRTA